MLRIESTKGEVLQKLLIRIYFRPLCLIFLKTAINRSLYISREIGGGYMKERFWFVISNEKGIANIVTTLMITPVLLFLCFSIVPFFVYTMKVDHLNTIANHALKEAEAVGYLSPAVIANTNARMAAMGLGATTISGTTYPTYVGSTTSKVLRDAAEPTITLIIKYPAPNLTKMLRAVGGSGTSSTNEGFFYIVLYGRSETYN